MYHIFNYAIIYLLSSPYREVRLFDLLSHSFLKRMDLLVCYSRLSISKFFVMYHDGNWKRHLLYGTRSECENIFISVCIRCIYKWSNWG